MCCGFSAFFLQFYHYPQLTTHHPLPTTHKKGSKSGGISITFFHVSGKNLPKPSEKKVPETAFQAQKQPEKRVYQTNRQLTLSMLEKKLKKITSGIPPYWKNTIFATAKTTRRSLKLMPI